MTYIRREELRGKASTYSHELLNLLIILSDIFQALGDVLYAIYRAVLPVSPAIMSFRKGEHNFKIRRLKFRRAGNSSRDIGSQDTSASQ